MAHDMIFLRLCGRLIRGRNRGEGRSACREILLSGYLAERHRDPIMAASKAVGPLPPKGRPKDTMGVGQQMIDGKQDGRDRRSYRMGVLQAGGAPSGGSFAPGGGAAA